MKHVGTSGGDNKIAVTSELGAISLGDVNQVLTSNRTVTNTATELLEISLTDGIKTAYLSVVPVNPNVTLSANDGAGQISAIQLGSTGLNLSLVGGSDFRVGSDPGTSGFVFTSSGPGAAPTWAATGVPADGSITPAKLSAAVQADIDSKAATGHTHLLANISDAGGLAGLDTITLGDVSDSGALAALNTVGAAQIDANAVTTVKILDANVTLPKIDLASTTAGLLPPRMTTTQRDAIGTPAEGLQVWNLTTNAANVYDGTTWIELGAGGGGGLAAPVLNVSLGDMATRTVKARLTAGTGDPEDVTIEALSAAFTGSSTSDASNFAMGSGAGDARTSGTNSVAAGQNAGTANTTGSDWCAIGSGAAAASISGGTWTAIGANAGSANTHGGGWTAIGANAAAANTTGYNWLCMGTGAAEDNTTGYNWTAIGFQAGGNTTTAFNWTAVGCGASFSNNTGTDFVALGFDSARFSYGSYHVAVGAEAGRGNYGGSWTAIGYRAGYAATGTGWVALGYEAARTKTSGTNWTALGYESGHGSTTGSGWTTVGYRAGYLVTTASNCTYIGGDQGTSYTTTSNVVSVSDGAGNRRFFFDGTNFFLTGLPATDPSVTGALWNDSGTFRVSA